MKKKPFIFNLLFGKRKTTSRKRRKKKDLEVETCQTEEEIYGSTSLAPHCVVTFFPSLSLTLLTFQWKVSTDLMFIFTALFFIPFLPLVALRLTIEVREAKREERVLKGMNKRKKEWWKERVAERKSESLSKHRENDDGIRDGLQDVEGPLSTADHNLIPFKAGTRNWE